MPTMPRSNAKATKIAYSITGKPSNMTNKKSALRQQNPTIYGITYGHRLVGTILR